ncbi:MAG: rRNA methyltransferase [Marinilabiliales bacterium]|nr:MAG: rRNA methyltransferase [Marinilabiliales bacterium]
MDNRIHEIINKGKGEAFLEFLFQSISEERRQRFQSISSNRTRHITVAIENIYQSHNASAVLRSCDCFGIQDVHIIEGSNQFNPNDEIALGAEKWLDIYKYNGDNPLDICYSELRQKGYLIAATTPHFDAIPVNNLPIDRPLALVFGTEKDGLTEEAVNKSDIRVALPMYGFTESFNISVSVALFLQKTIDKSIENNSLRYLSEEERHALLIQWCLKSIRNSENLFSVFENTENA